MYENIVRHLDHEIANLQNRQRSPNRQSGGRQYLCQKPQTPNQCPDQKGQATNESGRQSGDHSGTEKALGTAKEGGVNLWPGDEPGPKNCILGEKRR